MLRPDRPDWRDVQGLTAGEAELRLRADGANELPGSRHRSTLAIALGSVREPMFLLLVAAASIYFVLGDLGEAFVLLGSVLVVIGITIYQEQRTERVLEALREMSSPRALVVRDGQQRRIPGREVVRGDLLVLAEGDRVAADARVLALRNLQLDESLLTGESAPVGKTPWTGEGQVPRPGGEDSPGVYSGTLVVRGTAIAEVVATGAHTEIGRIGRSLQTLRTEPTPLQRQTRRLMRVLASVGLVLCVGLVVVHGLTRGDWVAGLLAGITFAMAMMPEEFPVVLTVFLALGAWRISRHRVLTRRVPAVETLGSATVLCVDKTGTLTQNCMAVHSLVSGDETFRVPDRSATETLPEAFHELLEFGILASAPNPFDPMERALRDLGQRYLASTDHLHDDWQHVHEYPLTRETRAVTHVWRSNRSADHVVATKGAPETIADLCHLDAAETARVTRQVEQLSAQGLRVLGVARARYGGRRWPPVQHDFEVHLLGLIALADPLRPTVPAAVARCKQAGIRVIMITGDYPGTALAVASQAGLDTGEVMTGDELERLSPAELRARLPEVNVFARVVPDQKLRLVEALKAGGEVVAMTGDGVNDAPALRAAHIGIAMGARGTDVAREASSLVLLDDDFASIVEAVRLGRRIHDNLRKAMAYVLAVHVPVAGLSLLPVLLGWPLLFAPVHVAFLELIIDPACSIAFEAEREERGLMQRSPRPPSAPLFRGRELLLSLLQGGGVLLVALAVYGTALHAGRVPGAARALAFTTLVGGNLGLIFVNRSWQRTALSCLRAPNRPLWIITAGAAAFLTLTLGSAPLRDVFQFAPVDAWEVPVAIVAGLASVAWFELLKLVRGPLPA